MPTASNAVNNDDARKLEEARFHDTRERDRHAMGREEYEKRYSNKKWYAATGRSRRFLSEWIERHARGRIVLDYCCGLGGMSIRFAKAGATVYGIDISPESVATARAAAQEAGVSDRCHFEVMDAEALSFPDHSFDVIVCAGVLHHLDVMRAFRELARVLKPSGAVIAGEALGHNPIIRAYRKLTPHLRTSWEADHILKMKDLRTAKAFFEHVEPHYFHLFSILATPFRRTSAFAPVLGMCNVIDDVVLRIPGLRLLAWQVIFFLRQPRSVPGSTLSREISS
jgi:ubiquinone/menaquinone biosynthesis C-methylase UbiE